MGFMLSVQALIAPLQALNKNVAAGFVTTNPTVKLTFPADNSTASQLARLNAAAVTLQNLEGPGIGCPISSTTFSSQEKAIEAKASNTTSSTPAVSPSVPATSTLGSCSVTRSSPTTTPAQTSPPASPSSPSITNTTSAISSSGNATTPTDAQIAALAPPLGWQSGINPDGTYDSHILRARNSRSVFKVLETAMEL